MKDFLIAITILFLSTLTQSYIATDQNKLNTGFYFLAEKESEGEIIFDIDSENKFAVSKDEILTVDDFSDVKFVQRDFKPRSRKAIEIKLTKEGRKKWAKIQKRMSKTRESIVFICNDKVYLEKRFLGNISLGNSKIDLFVDPQYQKDIFLLLRLEIYENTLSRI